MKPEISTPCIGVCKLNSNNVCMGCGRLLEQIAQWQQYSEAERQGIMQELVATESAQQARLSTNALVRSASGDENP